MAAGTVGTVWEFFHGSLTSHSRDIGYPETSFDLPNGSASFRSENS
jgi:hypothetical protein